MEAWKTWVALLALIGIVYGAMVALVQKDFKFVIGYSSVSHMGFVLLGLMHSATALGRIVLGIHSGRAYRDCSPEFVEVAQRALDLYTGSRFKLVAPFLKWNKVDIAVYCHTHYLPVDLTYSCPLGLDQPCGRCNACKDLLVLRSGH